jgi:hypothetical protein
MRSIVVLACAGMATLAIETTTPLAAQIPDAPLRMTAFAVNMSTVGRGGANTVDIQINRWSTDAERQQLVAAFTEKGSDALLRELQRLKKVGFIRLPNTLGYDLHFARKHPGEDGGEQIIIATDRRIGFWEARDQPRTMDYPFTLIDIRLKTSGEGEGKMSVATKISFNKKKNTLELENYASEPVRLTTVKAAPVKR